MMNLSRILAALAAIAVVALPATIAAAAEDDEVLGVFRDWIAQSYVEEGGVKICYMYTAPKESKGNYTRRGATYVMVTRRAGDSIPDVVHVEAGYPYREESDVSLRIDNDTFNLFTSDETAWAATEEEDRDIVAAMVRGVRMTVEGTSRRGTDTTDRYSLLGFTAARDAMTGACGP